MAQSETTAQREALPLEGRFGRLREAVSEHWFEYLLVTPTVLFMILLMWGPFFRGVWMSFHQWPFIGDPEWVGLGNYEYLLEWRAFYTSLEATVIFATTVIFQLAIALTASLLVANQNRFKNLLSVTFLIPYTMPGVVTGTIWVFLLNPDLGPFFGYLVEWGLLESPIYWATQGDMALAVVMFAVTWAFWPFMFLVILATLESIPTEQYESAKVYGANRLQRFLRITLPQIKTAILIAVSIRIVWNLVKVSQPLQMTGGGPGYDTSILAVLMYRFAYKQSQMGLSYAIGMVLLIVVLLFVVLFIREFEKESGGQTHA
jgi:ABC-type sugar transport system permease subunit